MFRWSDYLAAHPKFSEKIAQVEEGPVDLSGYRNNALEHLASGYAINYSQTHKLEYWVTKPGVTLPLRETQHFDMLHRPRLGDESSILHWLWQQIPSGIIRRYRKQSNATWSDVPSIDFRLTDSSGGFLGFYTIREVGNVYTEAAIIRGDRPEMRFPFNLDVFAEHLRVPMFDAPDGPRSRMHLEMTRLGYIFPTPVYSELTMTEEFVWNPGGSSTVSTQVDAGHLYHPGSTSSAGPFTAPEVEEGPVVFYEQEGNADFVGAGHRPKKADPTDHEEWWEVPRDWAFPFQRTVYLDLNSEEKETETIIDSALYCRDKTKELQTRSVHATPRSACETDWPKKVPGQSASFWVIYEGETIGIYSHRRDASTIPVLADPPQETPVKAFFEVMVIQKRDGLKLPLNFNCTLKKIEVDPVGDTGHGINDATTALATELGPDPLGPTTDYFARVEIRDYEV